MKTNSLVSEALMALIIIWTIFLFFPILTSAAVEKCSNKIIEGNLIAYEKKFAMIQNLFIKIKNGKICQLPALMDEDQAMSWVGFPLGALLSCKPFSNAYVCLILVNDFNNASSCYAVRPKELTTPIKVGRYDKKAGMCRIE